MLNRRTSNLVQIATVKATVNNWPLSGSKTILYLAKSTVYSCVKSVFCILGPLLCLGASACAIAQSGAIKRAYNAVSIGEYDFALAQLALAEKYGGLSEHRKIEIAYLKAKSYEGLSQVTEAVREYQFIDSTFPKSPYGYLAKEKLKYLQGAEQAPDEPLESAEKVQALSESLRESPLATNTARKDPAFRNYLNDIRKKIDTIWSYPCVKTAGKDDCDFSDAKVTIEVNVTRDGNLSSTRVLKKPGIAIYDFHAIEAIVLAAPFAAAPADLTTGASTIRLVINFKYVDNRMQSTP